MTDVASVHEALVKLNQHTAARFDKTANTLIEVLDDQDLSAWCELVLKISQSGWHSWEVLNYYLAAVPVLMSLGDVNSLLHRLAGSVELPVDISMASLTLNMKLLLTSSMRLSRQEID